VISTIRIGSFILGTSSTSNPGPAPGRSRISGYRLPVTRGVESGTETDGVTLVAEDRKSLSYWPLSTGHTANRREHGSGRWWRGTHRPETRREQPLRPNPHTRSTQPPPSALRRAAMQRASDWRLSRAELDGSRFSSTAQINSDIVPSNPSGNHWPTRRGDATPFDVCRVSVCSFRLGPSLTIVPLVPTINVRSCGPNRVSPRNPNDA